LKEKGQKDKRPQNTKHKTKDCATQTS